MSCVYKRLILGLNYKKKLYLIRINQIKSWFFLLFSFLFDFDFTYFWILTDNYRFYGLHEFSDGITKSYFLNVSLVTNNYPSYDSNSHDSPAYFGTWGSKYCTRVKYSNKVLNWFIVYTGSNSNEYTASSQFNRSNIVYSYIAF